MIFKQSPEGSEGGLLEGKNSRQNDCLVPEGRYVLAVLEEQQGGYCDQSVMAREEDIGNEIKDLD